MGANIVTIVLDSVRFDRIFAEDSVDTPNIDSLAQDSTHFSQAFSTGSWTVPAHGSLFTGELPSHHGSYAGQEHFDVDADAVLASKLAKQGYQTVGFSTNPWISTEFGYDKGFEEFIEITPGLPFPEAGGLSTFDLGDSRAEYWKEICNGLFDGPFFERLINGLFLKTMSRHPISSAEEVNEEINSWLRDRESSEPLFAFINYMDAHEPYRIRPDYAASEDVLAIEENDLSWNHKSLVNPPSSEEEGPVRLLYDSSIRYLDEQIGELMQILRQREYYDDSYVVLLSDHGQALGENDYWGHGTFLLHELLHVPMLIKTPSRCQETMISTPVSIKDIHNFLMTISHDSSVSDCRIADAIQGTVDEIPAFAESHGPYETNQIPDGAASSEGYRVMYYGSWRLHRDLETDEVIVEKTQAGSTEDNLSKAKLLHLEEEYYSGIETKAQRKEADISESTKQRLESLGYR